MMRVLNLLAVAALAAAPLGCSSEPLTADTGMSDGGGNGPQHTSSGCSAALKQSLSLVDEVSTATVATLSTRGDERTLYVDASVGGLDGQDTNPWIYVSLETGLAVPVTDLSAFESLDWDLAFKRTVIRTNGGDSGPGTGGALRVGLAWDKVSRTTLGSKTVPAEAWFDDDCVIGLDSTNNLITTFSGWSEYDEVDHVVSAAPDVVYITASAKGTLYKVQVEDYYSTPTGTHGNVAGRYKLRTAPLP